MRASNVEFQPFKQNIEGRRGGCGQALPGEGKKAIRSGEKCSRFPEKFQYFSGGNGSLGSGLLRLRCSTGGLRGGLAFVKRRWRFQPKCVAERLLRLARTYNQRQQGYPEGGKAAKGGKEV